jgi:hypothetical protein
MQKQVQFKPIGMQRDKSVANFSAEYAYENRNIRITATNENTLMSMSNEKGTKLLDIKGLDSISGIPIGQATLDDELILFTTGLQGETNIDFEGDEQLSKDIDAAEEYLNDSIATDKDKIYKLYYNNGKLNGEKLFGGDLGFDYKHPIETLSFYENDKIKKVYWVDGANQPRMINTALDSNHRNWDNHSFDFIRRLKLLETIEVNKETLAGGTFSPGVVQYAFTYYDKYGQETNIFHTTPLYYVSYNNRGASPEDKVSNSFKISIVNPDTSFDYIRIYSIHRTSIDATPTVKRVIDLSTNSSETIESLKTNTVSTYSVKASLNSAYLRLKSSGTKVAFNDAGITATDSASGKVTYYTIPSKYDRIYFEDSNIIVEFNSKGTSIMTTTYTTADTFSISNVSAVYAYGSGISYVDTGTNGDNIDPTELLYVGGEQIVAGTLAQKDNTLFLGDIKLTRSDISINTSVKTLAKKLEIAFTTESKKLTVSDPTGIYPYNIQLDKNSQQIKFFKYLEYYRFGIQAQHYTGKWSNPIYIGDFRNEVPIETTFYNNSDIKLPVAKTTIDNTLLSLLAKAGYCKIRPVIVYPEMSDREAICQGILCPTVFNVEDRYGNSPFVQSSWFTRPMSPFDITKASDYKDSSDGNSRLDYYSLNDRSINGGIFSRYGVVTNWNSNIALDNDSELPNLGAWAEFRHNYPIPSNDNYNAEIQCITTVPDSLQWQESSKLNTWISKYRENFCIDNSIVTMHSPDIEFDTRIQNLDTTGLKLRIIGIVPVTSFVSDLSIEVSSNTTPYGKLSDTSKIKSYPAGFNKKYIEVRNSLQQDTNNRSFFGWRGLIAGGFWKDEVYDRNTDNASHSDTTFMIYPWHRSGSLNNCKGVADGETRPSMLKTKRMSNLRFSYKTQYVPSLNTSSNNEYSISGVSVFNSDEVTALRIPEPQNSGLGDLIYYGNVDKVVIPDFSQSKYASGSTNYGYQIRTVNSEGKINSFANDSFNDQNAYQGYGKDPVRISYKSTPHAVLAFNYTSNNRTVILPTFTDGDEGGSKWTVNYQDGSNNPRLYWDKNNKISGVSQDVFELPQGNYDEELGPQYGFLWLGELFNPSVTNRFGGTTEEAIQNNKWLPCGDVVTIADLNDNDEYVARSHATVIWDEGDTYYQRYDHLKTYAFSNDMPNSIVDIISFMCETRVNIDGRYDRNRGQSSNLSISPTNFNLMNEVYSQKNNFFNYRTSVNEELDDFGYSLTWTKTKSPGETVDIWTNVTMASTLDLDGDKGNITAIRRSNNNLLAFQPKGISQILYNENTQITSTEGVPIEIANSGKVSGKRYLSNKVGCNNKWSICETPSGLFFVDDYNKGIYLMNNGLPEDVSDKLGFHSWINQNANMQSWNPIEFKSIITYYDKINKEVMFVTKKECLTYSEIVGQFTSFYSYDRTPIFANIEDTGLFINVERGNNIVNGVYKVWEEHEGDYNMFFGKYNPFSVTVIANPEATTDKIFDILEYRSDTWQEDELLDTTFDTLETWNEYQSGKTILVDTLNRPSSIKKKFRIWRANIPRDSKHKMDRMRNPWLYVKLSMNNENVNKTLLHDLSVQYFT